MKSAYRLSLGALAIALVSVLVWQCDRERVPEPSGRTECTPIVRLNGETRGLSCVRYEGAAGHERVERRWTLPSGEVADASVVDATTLRHRAPDPYGLWGADLGEVDDAGRLP